MIIVNHRVNDSELLEACKSEYGVEIDVRSDSSGLYLCHDPFKPGERLENWLESYDHRLLIVNVKEDGLEGAISSELQKRGVRNYFFLDQAVPTIIRRGLAGFRDSAIRFSEFESIETVERMSKFASWVWIDSFLTRDLDQSLVEKCVELGLKSCLVSPELHDISRSTEAEKMIGDCARMNLRFDAVCTKFPEKWAGIT